MSRVLISSDNFDRANGGLGGNWTTITGMEAPQIVSNEVREASNVDDIASEACFTGGGTPPNDQWSEIRIRSLTPDNTKWVAALCRSSTAAQTHYRARAEAPVGAATNLRLERVDAGVVVLLASATAAVALGDLLGCECLGTSLRLTINGSSVMTATDATYGSGEYGLGCHVNTGAALGNARCDDWRGGRVLPGGLRRRVVGDG